MPERRRQRLPDDHPVALTLKQLRECIILFQAAVEATRIQNDRALYAALARLDEAPNPDP